MTRRAVPPPTGGELLDELRAEARRRGVSLKALVMPLATSSASNFIQCLGRSTTPMSLTIARVRALIAGEPIPDARPMGEARQARGVKHFEADAAHSRLSGDQIAALRDLTDRARAAKRPGETLHDAIQRLTEGERE